MGTQGDAAPFGVGETRVICLEWEDSRDGAYIQETTIPWLSSQELDRWKAFRHDGARLQFLVSRWGMKAILSTITGRAPNDIHWKTDVNGRPYWDDPILSTPALDFNFSHTDGACAFALAIGTKVGVDIENPRRVIKEYVEISRRFFTEKEVRWIMEPECENWIRFLRVFTMKEAFLKARGEGLSGGLSSFEVPLSEKNDSLIPYWLRGQPFDGRFVLSCFREDESNECNWNFFSGNVEEFRKKYCEWAL